VVNVRQQIAMTDEESAAYLAAGRTLVVVTIGPDGLPDPVPMWYVLDPAGQLRMRTYAASQKVVNLRRDSRVSCLVEDGDRYNELRGVQLTGTLELVDDPDWIADVIVGLALKYENLDPAHAEAVRESARNRAGKQVGLLLHVDHSVSWNHGKLAPAQPTAPDVAAPDVAAPDVAAPDVAASDVAAPGVAPG
jgi:PPOX class probable F420-dependent enzyme